MEITFSKLSGSIKVQFDDMRSKKDLYKASFSVLGWEFMTHIDDSCHVIHIAN